MCFSYLSFVLDSYFREVCLSLIMRTSSGIISYIPQWFTKNNKLLNQLSELQIYIYLYKNSHGNTAPALTFLSKEDDHRFRGKVQLLPLVLVQMIKQIIYLKYV